MKFSIIIPTCNRPAQLQECIRRVMLQPGENYEIIVTDDSRAPTPQLLPHKVRGLRGPRRGPAANRNHGARHATGEWLIFLDDDCLPHDQWLAAYAAAALPGIDVLEGRTECPLADTFTPHEIVENLTGGALWSCNFAILREEFVSLQGFDEDFTQPCAEDMEFASRIHKLSLKIIFVKQAIVTHPPRRLHLLRLIQRSAAHRWILLYRLKTGISPAPNSPVFHAIADLVTREYLDNLRLISHLWRKNTRRPKQRIAEVLWRCLTLNLFLPYYILWDLRYRRAFTPP